MTAVRVSRCLVTAVAALLLSMAPGGIGAEPPRQTSSTPNSPPLTPGTVALLANQLDAAAIEQLRAALVHQDPTVRAVAARVAGVAKVGALIADLRGALARELNEEAAAELLRALLFFDEPGARESAVGHLARAKGPTVRVYLEWLGRTGPADLAERVEMALRPLAPADMSRLAPAITTLVLRYPAVRERVLRTWLRVAPGGPWRKVLDALGADGAKGDDAAVLGEALRSDASLIRQETVWAIVERLARRIPVAAATLEAAMPLEPSSASPAGTPISWERFGRELIARRHRKETALERSEFLKTEAPVHRSDARMLPLLREVTAAELSALRGALGDLPKPVSPRSLKTPPGQRAVRTVPIPWPNFLDDLLERSGCKVTATPVFGAINLKYRPDGRPAAGSLDGAGLPPACGPVLAALARMTLADPKHVIAEGASQWVLLPVSRDFVTCVAGVAAGGSEVAGWTIEEPQKIHDVRPVYPTKAQEARIRGTVTLEGTISETGCISSLEVLGSAHPALDAAAIYAVSGWRFTPTLVDGQPTPVIMTVTVNFILQ